MRLDDHTTGPMSAEGLRIAVVTAKFNRSITEGLKDGALEFLAEVHPDETLAIDAPGAFELPLIAQQLASSGYDAVICLGAVIEGDTDHYEHVAHRASEGLMRVQLDTGVPMAFGILTTRDVDTAIMRSAPGTGNKGREAAEAGVRAALLLKELRSSI